MAKIKKPRAFGRGHNKLQVCGAIDSEYPMSPHIWGELDYLTYKDWPALSKWMNDASRWLAAQDDPTRGTK